MSDINDELAGELRASRPKRAHPKGWEPGVDTAKGVITHRATTAPDETQVDWSWLLEDYGLSADEFMVKDDEVQVRSWDSNLGAGVVERFYYYRATIVRRGSDDSTVDYDDLVKWIRRRKPVKARETNEDAPRSLVVVLSDTQLGKADGDGTRGIVERIKKLEADLPEHVRSLRKSGINIQQLTILGAGDIVEGCTGFYAMQDFSVELDRRAQFRLAYELLVSLIDKWVDLAPEMLVACVAGNHGENRKNGKAFTSFADNDDVACFEVARKVTSMNPDRFGHVRWLIPNDELSISMDVQGTIVGLTHGHQSRPGRFPHTKVWDWWEKQQMGRRPVADADVLVSGHFHHLSVLQQSGRWALQCPSLDGGSRWFEEQYGMESDAGVLTFVTGAGQPVSHLRVL